MQHRLKSKAIQFRNKFGYNSNEPLDCISLLRQLDILTIFKPLSENFSGLSIKSDDNKFILVNSDQSEGRQNFTICHEIYHLYFDDNFSPHKCYTEQFHKKNISEKYADIFASHLLLPEEGIIRMIPEAEEDKNKIKLSTILKIEQTYRSSRRALLNQLINMNLISKKFAEYYATGIKTGALKHGYDLDLYQSNGKKSVLGSYGSLANKLFEEEKISEGHYHELMSAIGIDILT
ncbi:MAG: ImmA/IrrE family metallo-endopeptidase [Prolixibacteraceae bacterium]|nr:ImmA/IrrE family metallo-endopeptidase [Prolixibacteraceae bacterium]